MHYYGESEFLRRLIFEMTCRGPAVQFYIPGVRLIRTIY